MEQPPYFLIELAVQVLAIKGDFDEPWRCLLAIHKERIRQDKLYTDDTFEIMESVFREEVTEVFLAAQKGDFKNLEEELIQVAAVCVKWVEKIDERKGSLE